MLVGSKYLVQVRKLKGTNLPDFELMRIHTQRRALREVNMTGTFGLFENTAIKLNRPARSADILDDFSLNFQAGNNLRKKSNRFVRNYASLLGNRQGYQEHFSSRNWAR